MQIKEKIKKILSNNPLATSRREKMRANLKNRDFTFLTPNCLGGILLHDLNLKFLTPTINLMIRQNEFLEFVLHLEEYIETPLVFIEHEVDDCPQATLSPEGLPKITIHFTHYKTEQEAKAKWVERSERINKDNLFVFIEERDGVKKEDLERLKSVNARGVVAFCCKQYTDIPFCVYISKYKKDGEVGNILKKSLLDDSREYERYFDFVKWFNESQGNFDVHPYCK